MADDFDNKGTYMTELHHQAPITEHHLAVMFPELPEVFLTIARFEQRKRQRSRRERVDPPYEPARRDPKSEQATKDADKTVEKIDKVIEEEER